MSYSCLSEIHSVIKRPFLFFSLKRFSMAPYESLWLLMIPYGSLWFTVTLYESLWVPMIPYGSLWFSMALYDSPVCLSLCLHFLKDEENGLKTTLGYMVWIPKSVKGHQGVSRDFKRMSTELQRDVLEWQGMSRNNKGLTWIQLLSSVPVG